MFQDWTMYLQEVPLKSVSSVWETHSHSGIHYVKFSPNEFRPFKAFTSHGWTSSFETERLEQNEKGTLNDNSMLEVTNRSSAGFNLSESRFLSEWQVVTGIACCTTAAVTLFTFDWRQFMTQLSPHVNTRLMSYDTGINFVFCFWTLCVTPPCQAGVKHDTIVSFSPESLNSASHALGTWIKTVLTGAVILLFLAINQTWWGLW